MKYSCIVIIIPLLVNLIIIILMLIIMMIMIMMINSQSLPARQSEWRCLQVSGSRLHWKNDHVHWTETDVITMMILMMVMMMKIVIMISFVWFQICGALPK